MHTSTKLNLSVADLAQLILEWLRARGDVTYAGLHVTDEGGGSLRKLVAVGQPDQASVTEMPLRFGDQSVGRLDIRPAADDLSCVCAAADQLAWLLAQSTHSTWPRTIMQRILPVTEEELSRIVLDIHDGPVQYLFAALSQLALLQTHLRCSDPYCPVDDVTRQTLTNIGALLENSLREIKHFLGTFRPPEFHRRDLLSIVEGLVIQHEEWTGDTVTLEIGEVPTDVALPVKIALYRILQEALSNAHRHAGVPNQEVRLWSEGEWICLTVDDHGRGFEPPPLEGPLATEREEHIGLRGMRDRVSLVGGTFHLESRPGAGTRILVKVPHHG
ncbi:MAG: sensor histidine kinase [Ardenticatenaceae bacterium]|nr:sensor histidine kinase [Ardenticatenaceae bacterium]HBY99434.1 sensor histidine kinase [Chloroflexota bacterium]